MKKVSTAAAKQSGNFSGQKLTSGLDLGDRSSYYCVLDERGESVLQQKIATTAKALPPATKLNGTSTSSSFDWPTAGRQSALLSG